MGSSLGSILSNAASGLRASQAGIAVISDNIANAGVAGYTSKTQDTSSFLVGNGTEGVRTGLVSRSIDNALQASAWAQASRVSALTVRSQVLTAVNTVQGTPGDGTSLADAVTALQGSFTNLQADPSSQTEQASVVSAANTLASAINNAADTITAQRNSAQSQIVASVSSLNGALATVRSTTHDIVTAKAANQDTSTLEDQRDQALQTISGLLEVSYDKQASGNIAILGRSGFSIPLDSTFSTVAATLSPGAPGGAPPIFSQLSDHAEPPVDVTSHLSGGSLGELVTLRDTSLPSFTANLDGFSAKLANQFSAQGLKLFSDASGTQPLTAYAGLSSTIGVNPAVTANPAAVRDGTPATPSPPDTAYPINPAGGPAGYTGLLDRVLSTSFAASPGTSIATDAAAFVAKQSQDTSRTSADLTNATAYRTTLASRLSSQSGVNVDQEMGLMIQLQNSYQANARVIQAAQSMFTALLNAV